MPDKHDRQLEIDMNGRRKIDQLYNGIPAPFVVKTGMDAVNLGVGPQPEVHWLPNSAVKNFSFNDRRQPK